MSDSTLAILGYHNIGLASPGGWETWFYISEDMFATHLTYLRDHEWTMLDVPAFLAALADPVQCPRKAALLTFDDGHRLMLGSALRQLRRFDMPAVLFVPTDYVGGTNSYDANTREPPEAICDWDDLRALERQRVSIQSHSASHSAFSNLSPAQLEDELGRSKSVLEEGLGRSVELFAYPYGDGGVDHAAVGAALGRHGYRAACLYDGGLNHIPVPDVFRLHRLYMGEETNLAVELGDQPAEAQARPLD
jgi:peptidoglycan/xylan/chitin deacetylase (PgdA/CDA1 family)